MVVQVIGRQVIEWIVGINGVVDDEGSYQEDVVVIYVVFYGDFYLVEGYYFVFGVGSFAYYLYADGGIDDYVFSEVVYTQYEVEAVVA